MNAFAAMAETLAFKVSKRPTSRVQAGDVFGRLTLTGNWTRDRYGCRTWHAICACGNDAGFKREPALLNGTVKSCGCIRRERGAATIGYASIWREQ